MSGATTGRRVIARGKRGAITWTLTAWRASGEVCDNLRVQSTSPPYRGDGHACGLSLPIDLSQSFSSTARFVFGPVTLEAASVGIVSTAQEWSVKPVGGDAGFGQAFYVKLIDVKTDLKEVVAYGKDGGVLGRKRSNNCYAEHFYQGRDLESCAD